MSHVPHELAEEFPAQAERIQALKLADQRFAALVERYHTVNRALHRMEERIEPVSESTERTLRRERLHLKDEVSRALEAQAV
ncbi:YdcH family protein [Methylobacterium sp. sgz302541]|uniref:YdcH family protein n=1 Tax=unclassified Methylobacterium TaxID=2615210 RepID=UPI003D346273